MTTPMEPPLRVMGASPRRKARAPRMAEVVADSLRAQILAGEIDVVPQLDVLVREFDVGPPAVREALRILETEGLVTVRRGKVGGADVHMPTNDRVAYTLSLVLQSNDAPLSDVGSALRHLEPVCAAMCAERPDRATVVVPRLRELLVEQEAAIGDRPGSLRIVDEFHAALVRECGNQTLVQVVGALEQMWASHAHVVLDGEGVELAPEKLWRAALDEHRAIVDAIEAGDALVAAGLANTHLVATHAYMSSVDDSSRVMASLVQKRL